jgi:hypothetical protein
LRADIERALWTARMPPWKDFDRSSKTVEKRGT